MNHRKQKLITNASILTISGLWLFLLGIQTAIGQESSTRTGNRIVNPLPVESVQVQGIRRTVRFYHPGRLSNHPAVLLLLHGGGGDGERFRRLTDRAFERLADEKGFLVAYPDAIGGQWNGCRANASYHEALAGIDEIAFLHSVVRRAETILGQAPAGVFVVGYSNGGHLVFRLALEAPNDFTALAAIGASLPVPGERDCGSSNTPVSIFLISGTDDPINPWAGGTVVPPGGGSLGQVISVEATADYFRGLMGSTDKPRIKHYPDRDRQDGTRVETRRWLVQGREVVLMAVHGGGHSLPYPTAHFPVDLVGRTSRDIDGARALWNFFRRHLTED
ncbi:MAG: PHB depolymerase family esterase [Gammaproteobacteria bacterium]